MIKFNYGPITNCDHTKEANIVAKSYLPNTMKDTIIGGLITLIGIGYLTVTAFRNGATSYEKGELEALAAIGVMDDPFV